MRYRKLLFVPVLLGAVQALPASAAGRTFHVDCGRVRQAARVEGETLLRAVEEVNALVFRAGDRVLFARGTTCHGTLFPQGSGTAAEPIELSSYGSGPLPGIEAQPGAESAFVLRDAEYWHIAQLDIRGGNRFGLLVTGGHGTLHGIALRDLRVHDVRGSVKRKEEGLISIHPTAPDANFDDLLLDGVEAYGTSQWSGIFISGGSEGKKSTHVRVQNATVHDVQGDGIVLFNVQDGVIRNATAWHTGMQHGYSIGTPNAIWTWHCTRCAVEDSEAFLSDSPGVDGGSFDIDFGNAQNRFSGNFGHDTQGYCLSVFAAFGETVDSEVAGNTCLRNGLSPRLAQRQGAILFMSWSGGAIRNTRVHDNLIFWSPAAATPAFQAGSGLKSTGLEIVDNTVVSTAPAFFAPSLLSAVGRNDLYFSGSAAGWEAVHNRTETAQRWPQPCTIPACAARGAGAPWEFPSNPRPGGEVTLKLANTLPLAEVRSLLSMWGSMATQFGSRGVHFTVAAGACHSAVWDTAETWQLAAKGIALQRRPCEQTTVTSFEWIDPAARPMLLPTSTTRAQLWLRLASRAGLPLYSELPAVDVPATD